MPQFLLGDTQKHTSIRRSRSTNLRLLDDIGVDAQDFVVGFRINVAATVVVTRSVDLSVTKVGQVGRSKSLWCAISMSVEHINSQHSLGRRRRRQKGQSNERLGQHFEARIEREVLDRQDSKSRTNRRLLAFYGPGEVLIIGNARDAGNPSQLLMEKLLHDSSFGPR